MCVFGGGGGGGDEDWQGTPYAPLLPHVTTVHAANHYYHKKKQKKTTTEGDQGTRVCSSSKHFSGQNCEDISPFHGQNPGFQIPESSPSKI